MKRLLVFFVLLCGMSFGLTSSHIKWSPGNDPSSHGPNFDRVVDENFASIQSAIEAGGVVPLASATIQGPIGYQWTSVNKDLWLVGNNSTFTAKGVMQAFLQLQVKANDISIHIDNLILDGDNRTARGIYILNNGNYTGCKVFINGCHVKNMTSMTAIDTNGIVTQGHFDIVEIKGCIVDNVYRSTLTREAKGIACTEVTGNVLIENNRVTNVLSNSGASWTDADSIAVFADGIVAGTIPDPHDHVVIRNNYLENFCGRAVKLQTPNAIVQGNTMRAASGTLMANSIFVDMQTGGGVVSDNIMIICASTTKGASQQFISVTSGYSTRRNVTIINNLFSNEGSAIPYGVIFRALDGNSTFNLCADGNVFSGSIMNLFYEPIPVIH